MPNRPSGSPSNRGLVADGWVCGGFSQPEGWKSYDFLKKQSLQVTLTQRLVKITSNYHGYKGLKVFLNCSSSNGQKVYIISSESDDWHPGGFNLWVSLSFSTPLMFNNSALKIGAKGPKRKQDRFFEHQFSGSSCETSGGVAQISGQIRTTKLPNRRLVTPSKSPKHSFAQTKRFCWAITSHLMDNLNLSLKHAYFPAKPSHIPYNV